MATPAGKLGVFVFNQAEDYHRMLAEEVVSGARQHGIAAEVFDAGQTAAKQAQDLVRFALENAGQRLCALVVPFADATGEGAIESDPTYRVARRVLQKGVGWIMLNHGREAVVAALRRDFPGLPVALVAVDNVEFGRIQARQLRSRLSAGARLLCVRGNPFDSACQERSAGLAEGLRGAGIVVEEVDGRWEPTTAGSAVERWVTSPLRVQAPLHAVVAQNDPMALAARRTLERLARDLARPELLQVPVFGGDALPGVGRRWVDEGTLAASVSVPLTSRAAVDLVVRHWQDGAPLPAVTRLVPQPYPR